MVENVSSFAPRSQGSGEVQPSAYSVGLFDNSPFESDSPNLTTNASDVASLDTELVSSYVQTSVVHSRTELCRLTPLLPSASNDAF